MDKARLGEGAFGRVLDKVLRLGASFWKIPTKVPPFNRKVLRDGSKEDCVVGRFWQRLQVELWFRFRKFCVFGCAMPHLEEMPKCLINVVSNILLLAVGI